MTACTSREPSSSGTRRCCSAESVGADSPMWAGSTEKIRSKDGIFFSIWLHSSTRRAPSSRRNSGLMRTRKSSSSGRTPASKLKVPEIQVNR